MNSNNNICFTFSVVILTNKQAIETIPICTHAVLLDSIVSIHFSRNSKRKILSNHKMFEIHTNKLLYYCIKSWIHKCNMYIQHSFHLRTFVFVDFNDVCLINTSCSYWHGISIWKSMFKQIKHDFFIYYFTFYLIENKYAQSVWTLVWFEIETNFHCDGTIRMVVINELHANCLRWKNFFLLF